MATNPQNWTDDDIKQGALAAGLVNDKYQIVDDNAANTLYNQAKKYGLTEDRLDKAFGYAPGTAAGWIKSKGYDSLTPKPQYAPPPPSKWEGLMQSLASGGAAAVPAPPAPVPYTPSGPQAPTQVQFDEAKGAAGRLASITAENSPLMQQAMAQGRREANARGLLNSSAGARAAQGAMIDRASPLAISDANAYANTQLANMQEANRWNMSAAERAQQESQFGRNLAEQARQANLAANTQLTVAGMNFDIQDRRLSQDDRQFLMDLDVQNRKLDTQIDQFAKSLGMDAARLDVEKGRLNQQDRQFYDQLKLDQQRVANQAQQFSQDWANRFTLQGQADQAKVDLAKLDGEIRQNLIGVEAQYKTSIAGNENISNAWGTMMQEIGRIQNNPDLEPAAKTTLLQNTIDSFRSFAGFWTKTSGIDVSDLLNFGISPAGGSTTNQGGNNGSGGGYGDPGGGL